MYILLAVGTGSFIGGILRYSLSQFLLQRTAAGFPFATMAVNIIGCFLIGLALGVSEKGQLTDSFKLFLATGLLGGFTTFSAFSHETMQLIRDGNWLLAGLYAGGSVVLGLMATVAGVWLAR